ncbi:ABC transporter substrate-binding protein [Phormidium tenue FACHB-886]|nr:ABC transporter substrate-binding protein [Phormidium tenue FACHB-886]
MKGNQLTQIWSRGWSLLLGRRAAQRRWRWLGIAIACFFCIVLSGTVAAQQPVRLALLTTALDAQGGQSLAREFEQKNPGIKVDVIEGPNASNLIEDLYTSSFLLGESPYDLILMDIVWLPKFAAAGWLLDLTDRIPADQLQAFYPADLEGGRYEGRLYRLPMRSDAGLLYYRQDLLEQAGLKPPETFDELIEESKQLQQSDAVPWGYVWQGRQYEGLSAMFVEVLAGSGGFWVNPETLEVGLDRPEAIQAVNFLRRTMQEGISPPGVTTYQEEEARRLFQSGQVAFMRSWPYAYPLGNAEDSPIRGKFAIKPMVHAAGLNPAACLGGWGLGISKTSRNPDAALRVVQYFASVEGQRFTILENGYLPTRPSLYSDQQIIDKYSYFPSMQTVAEQAVLRPPVAQYAQVSDILQRYLSAALTDRTSVEAAMQAAAAETRRLLDTNQA